MKQVDVVVLGVSLTGYAAAIRLAEMGILVALVYWNNEWVSYLNFVDPTFFNDQEVAGKSLEEKLLKDYQHLGTPRMWSSAKWLRFVNGKVIFEASHPREETFQARLVVYCPWLVSPQANSDLPGFQSLIGCGISILADHDGCIFRNQPMAVMGNEDWAFEEALHAAKYGSHVTIFCENEPAVKRQSLQAKVLASPKITIMSQTKVTGFAGDQETGVTGLYYEQQGSRHFFPCPVVFWAKLDPRNPEGLESWKELVNIVPETLILPAGTEVGIPYTDHAALVEDGFRVAEAARQRLLHLD